MTAQAGLFADLAQAKAPTARGPVPAHAPQRSAPPPPPPPPSDARPNAPKPPQGPTGPELRRQISGPDAIKRFAWAVKDLRALGLAGSWTVRLAYGDERAAVIIEFDDDATAQRASDAIWGDFQA